MSGWDELFKIQSVEVEWLVVLVEIGQDDEATAVGGREDELGIEWS